MALGHRVDRDIREVDPDEVLRRHLTERFQLRARLVLVSLERNAQAVRKRFIQASP